jgi:hypothetical protein
MPVGVYKRKLIPPIERLLKHIIISEAGCWEWVGAKQHGYGNFSINGKGYRSHRVSWEFFNEKPIPNGLEVCHHCDNPSCINPDHLFLGTHEDNLRDMNNKNRAFFRKGMNMNSGNLNPSAKLSLLQVKEIKESLKNFKPGLCTELALQYRVCNSTIKDIKQGRKWGFVKV